MVGERISSKRLSSTSSLSHPLRTFTVTGIFTRRQIFSTVREALSKSLSIAEPAPLFTGVHGDVALALRRRAFTDRLRALAHGLRALAHGLRALTHGLRALAHRLRALAHGLRALTHRLRALALRLCPRVRCMIHRARRGVPRAS
jgi:hypothetical protein